MLSLLHGIVGDQCNIFGTFSMKPSWGGKMIIIFKLLYYIKESENFKFNMIQSARTSGNKFYEPQRKDITLFYI